jgi:uncharacterized protein YbbC (DUF1343 family)
MLRYPPSPNLKNMAAVYLYPSICFFEGTVVSIGRGTAIPFQQWGHPAYSERIKYSFVPKSMAGATKPLYENKQCWGMIVAKTSNEALDATNESLCMKWLLQAYGWYPDKEQFFIKYFNNLSANKDLEEQIKKGMTEKQIHESWQKGIIVFKRIRKKYLIYNDFE